MPATDLPKQYPFTDRPEYNDYIVAREMDIIAFPFAPDPDWRTTPTDVLLLDGNGRPVQRFQVPLISGRASAAWAFTVVGINEEGAEVDPTGGSVTITPMEVINYSGNYQTEVPHVVEVSQFSATDPFALANTPITGTVEFNRLLRMARFGGDQNQFVFRVTALTPPAGTAKVRFLVKPLGT